MAVWHLIETDRPDRTARAGFTVVDAARRCTGTVNGWVVGPNGAIAFLRVMMPGVTGSGHLLLPVGLIDRIDDTRSCLYLRPGATRHLHPACHVSGSPLPLLTGSPHSRPVTRPSPRPWPGGFQR
ncbi:MAG: hypothetical protein KatS3mg042_0421 [Rhodothermaceae bacterium]|nr:MAG: hypothetical protein KatS3mg042_0421 [Rhodothermaceae bacterium]